jgi:hypothetical protein
MFEERNAIFKGKFCGALTISSFTSNVDKHIYISKKKSITSRNDGEILNKYSSSIDVKEKAHFRHCCTLILKG